jgi:hypothetical protein
MRIYINVISLYIYITCNSFNDAYFCIKKRENIIECIIVFMQKQNLLNIIRRKKN